MNEIINNDRQYDADDNDGKPHDEADDTDGHTGDDDIEDNRTHDEPQIEFHQDVVLCPSLCHSFREQSEEPLEIPGKPVKVCDTDQPSDEDAQGKGMG